MIVSTIIGNTHDDPALIAGRHVEKVILPQEDFRKRIQRLTTDHGTQLGLRLPAGSPDLKDGDVVSLTDSNAIVIAAEPTDVIVIAPASIAEMGRCAHNLGNRHLPAQFFDAASDYGADVMVVPYDHTVADYLRHESIAFERQARVLPVPFRHAEHTH